MLYLHDFLICIDLACHASLAGRVQRRIVREDVNAWLGQLAGVVLHEHGFHVC